MRIAIAHFTNWWVGKSGGMERVVCQFANAMCARGHEVTILYLGDKEGNPFYPLNPMVNQVNILFENGKQIVPRRLSVWKRVHRELARLLSQRKAREVNTYYRGKLYGPRIQAWLQQNKVDVVISCSPDSAKYLLLDGKCAVPVIEMTHVDPAVEFFELSKHERQALMKVKLLQLPLDSGVAVAKKYFPQLPLVVIGNPVNRAERAASPGIRKDKHVITGVGFVNASKNWKLLADAFAGLYKKYPDWNVEIWGEASAHGYAKWFQRYIERLHLGDRFFLKGRINHIEEIYAKSDIFAFPSKSEGFGMALSEAMAAGLPVIGLKICNGVNSLIKDGVDGYLTESTSEAFREALERLMKNPALRVRMGQEGRQAMRAYAPEKIWDLWERAIKSVVKEG